MRRFEVSKLRKNPGLPHSVGWLLGFPLVFGWMQGGAQTGRGAAAAMPGCTLIKQVYTCDRAQFRQALALARTAAIDPGTRDRMVSSKLRDLVASLGKGSAALDASPDLTFSLVPVETSGVMVGPAGVDLAVLRVYGPADPTRTSGGASNGADSSKGALLWAETFRGQPDMSWPATVQATIEQFRAGLKLQGAGR